MPKRKGKRTAAAPTKATTLATDAAEPEDELSEYERQRLEHIRRNHEYMVMLGLADAKDALANSIAAGGDAPKRAKKIKIEVPEEDKRRSSRVKGAAPDYSGERIDRFGEAVDSMIERAQARRAKRELSDADVEAQRAEILEEGRQWLEQSRKALLRLGNFSCCSGDDDAKANQKSGQHPQTSQEWRQEAIGRWGSKVADLAIPDWEQYTLSRLSTPPPASPMDLLQEYYAHDPWRLLISCTLMSRVSSVKVKHKCIGAFFEKYPTPSATLDADVEDIFTIIAPLGLFENRLQSLISVSQRFLEMPVFDCGLDPDVKIYGIGEFGVDSFKIFCRGLGLKMSPNDRTLAAFVSWLKKNHGSKVNEGVE